LGDNHPICPVFLGDAKLASTFADKMLGKLINIDLQPDFNKSQARFQVICVTLSISGCAQFFSTRQSQYLQAQLEAKRLGNCIL